jgi:hypothetical protein
VAFQSAYKTRLTHNIFDTDQLSRVMEAYGQGQNFPLLFISVLLTPLQGLPTFLVYLRPEFRKIRSQRGSILNRMKSCLIIQTSSDGTRRDADNLEPNYGLDLDSNNLRQTQITFLETVASLHEQPVDTNVPDRSMS